MADYIKEPHTAIFTGQTKCGKTHLVIDLIEKEYSKYFDYIIIICPTLRFNKTYHSEEWIKKDDNIWLIEPPKYIISRTLKYYLSLMTSSLMKDLTRGRSPCWN